jgi:peptidyl-prolyl cis-trans isomerase SurA
MVLAIAGPGRAEVVDRIVAIVNDDVITLSELEEAVSSIADQIQPAARNPEQIQEMRREVLDRMIQRKLTEQQGEALGVSVSDREVEQQIERIKESEFLTESALAEVLEAEGYTLEEYKKRIKHRLLGIKLINREVKSKVAITDDEIRAYYEEHKADYAGEKQYHLRTILVRMPAWEEEDGEPTAQDKIEEIAIRLRAGAPFEEIARQYSEDVTAETGGDIGWFSIDELTEELRETVRWMEEGEISPVLQTDQGYQILKLEAIRGKAGKTLEEAKPEIQEKIYRQMVEERYEAWLEDLRKEAYIKIML